MLLGIPGIWWIDLQIDGVKKGSLAKHYAQRMPQPSTVIASSFTSPIDSLYLAAIFDPIFTISYPHTRQVQYISLFGAILRALRAPQEYPPKGAKLTDLGTLVNEHPKRVIVVFPECTTTNGRGILPFSPGLLNVPATTKIFPLSLRYTPADITTPVPNTHMTFLWNLLSQTTHCVHVRVAEAIYNRSSSETASADRPDRYLQNVLDQLDDSLRPSSALEEVGGEEQKVLDRVAEALARLGRVKRVGLTVRDKAAFVEAWSKKKR